VRVAPKTQSNRMFLEKPIMTSVGSVKPMISLPHNSPPALPETRLHLEPRDRRSGLSLDFASPEGSRRPQRCAAIAVQIGFCLFGLGCSDVIMVLTNPATRGCSLTSPDEHFAVTLNRSQTDNLMQNELAHIVPGYPQFHRRALGHLLRGQPFVDDD